MAEFELAGQEMGSPVISMAGVLNDRPEAAIIEETEAFAASSIGAITQGSTTPLERVGNAARYGGETDHWDPQTRLMTNAKGLPNIGLDRMQAIVPDLVAIGEQHGTPMIFSVSPEMPEEAGLEIGTPTEQTLRLVQGILTVGGKLVEINVSCPNVIGPNGERKPMVGYDPESVDELTEALIREFGDQLGIGIKVAPFMEGQEDVARAVTDTVVSSSMYEFVTTANTINGHRPLNDDGTPAFAQLPQDVGGRSGPGEWAEGRNQLRQWTEAVERNGADIEIVSGLGVGNGTEVARRLMLGASAVGANTIFYRSADMGVTAEQVLSEYADELDV